MRTLLIGALAAILVSWSCYVPPQPDMATCTQANAYFCFDGVTDPAPVEIKVNVNQGPPREEGSEGRAHEEDEPDACQDR